ncbi:Single-stranded DNA-binding protein [Amycolatopsis sp. CA-230715]|nr:Single-stranded DNA-binding protein [Amycolatopsis sp. CA-230715]
MAVGETPITVVGNVLSELTRRTVPSGHEVVSFWLRSNERRYDKETNDWVDGRQLTVKVTCWRKLAIGAFASIGKGDPVVVTGRLSTSEYAADGQTRSIPEVEASAVGPNLARCTATVRRNSRDAVPDTPGLPSFEAPAPRAGSDEFGANALVTGAVPSGAR